MNKKVKLDDSIQDLADPSYEEVKKKLIAAVDVTMERKFAEEVEFLDNIKAEAMVAESFSVDFSEGISSAEVEDRRRKFGSNQREEKKGSSYCRLLLNSLGDFTLRILLVASIVSIIINETTNTDQRSIGWIEGFAIFMAVMISSNVQALNDYQKEKQFKKLNGVAEGRKKLSVLRDNGTIVQLQASDLIPGDIVLISEGTDIPADGLVLEAHGLTADESAMTGETEPIKKNTIAECLKLKNEFEEEGRRNTTGSHEIPSPILLAGTKVASGTGKYVVILVGKDSSIGKIRDLLEQEEEATPLQVKLEKIAGDIGKFGLVSAIFIMVILFIRFLADRARNHDWDDASQWKDLLDYFIIGITVVVVAIPEGLPLAVALSLAYSVGRMLKDQNLVRKLQACETMGGANMICSDKTGTLTQNKMDLSCFWNGKLVEINVYEKNQDIFKYIQNSNYKDLFLQACICNTTATLEPLDGSQTDIALLQFGANMGISVAEYKKKHVTSSSIIFPFTSKRKRMSTVLENVANGVLGNRRMYLKGASEYIVGSCNQIHLMDQDQVITITPEIQGSIEAAIKMMADDALRTIGIAYKDITGDEDFQTADSFGVQSIEKGGFIFIGILGIKDMLRNEVKEAVAKCKKAGIKVRMVTGDNKDTARAIARECGISNPQVTVEDMVLEGSEFDRRVGGVICKSCKTKVCGCPRDKKTASQKGKPIREDTIQNKEEFAKIVQNLDVLARSRPEDKYTLVTGLRELGHVVAVTGDGTNDAPALKKADVGFAMGIAGTEVAREAASIILLDDNFNSIVAAVLWGRNIYDSIRKFLQFQLTVNVVAVCLTLFGSALYRMAILTPVQMLWVNLIMDTLASLALATENPDPILLDRQPHKRDEYILSRKMIKFITFHAFYQLLVMLILTCLGDRFIPEWSDLESPNDYFTFNNNTTVQVRFSSYGNGRQYVISGRLYQLNGDDDYEPYDSTVGGSRHLTVVFDTFVFMQVFNFFNARKLEDELNIFGRIHKSPLFLIILLFIIILQVILGMFGNRPLHVFRDGTNIEQWGIAIAFGFGEWVVGALSKLVPDKIFQQGRKDKKELVKNPSKINSIKRSLQKHSKTTRNAGALSYEIRNNNSVSQRINIQP